MSDLLRLRIIIGSLSIGGTECHLMQILPELIKKGWSITLVTTTSRKPNDLGEALENMGVDIKSQPRWAEFTFLPRYIRYVMHLFAVLLRLMREFRRDTEAITHFFLPEAYLMGSCAALLVHLHAPKIMSRRSLNYYQKKRPVMAWLEKKFHKKVDFILGNSKAIVKQLHQEEQVPLHKLGLIYNGIDASAFVPTESPKIIRDKLGISSSTFVLTMVANLIPYKGHRDLITALGMIHDKLPQDWQLLCVGRDDGIKAQLMQWAKEQGIQEHIQWIGTYRPVVNILSITQLGIHCSHEEGFSNAILEGMAAKLPMIVTAVGGNTEVIIHEESGIIVPAHNPKALSQAIVSLIHCPDTLNRLGKAAYQRISDYFSLKTCVEAYHEFYVSLLTLHRNKMGGPDKYKTVKVMKMNI